MHLHSQIKPHKRYKAVMLIQNRFAFFFTKKSSLVLSTAIIFMTRIVLHLGIRIVGAPHCMRRAHFIHQFAVFPTITRNVSVSCTKTNLNIHFGILCLASTLLLFQLRFPPSTRLAATSYCRSPIIIAAVVH